MIWILGEYCDRIDNVDELLGSFLENFHDENSQVQLQLLTSTVKLFLKRPSDTSDLVQNVLSLATQDSDNPDLRDRGYIYWRLLSTDPGAAKDVVLAEKPTISEETDLLEPVLLDELICHISTLASVYHKPPSAFVDGKVPVRRITLQPRAEPYVILKNYWARISFINIHLFLFNHISPILYITFYLPFALMSSDLLGTSTSIFYYIQILPFVPFFKI